MNFMLQIYDLFGYGFPGLAFCFLVKCAWPGFSVMPKGWQPSSGVEMAGGVVLVFAVGVVLCSMVGKGVERLTRRWGLTFHHTFPCPEKIGAQAIQARLREQFGDLSDDLLYRCCRLHLANVHPQTHFECERQMALRAFSLNLVASCIPLGAQIWHAWNRWWGVPIGLACAILLAYRALLFQRRAYDVIYIGCYTALVKHPAGVSLP